MEQDWMMMLVSAGVEREGSVDCEHCTDPDIIVNPGKYLINLWETQGTVMYTSIVFLCMLLVLVHSMVESQICVTQVMHSEGELFHTQRSHFKNYCLTLFYLPDGILIACCLKWWIQQTSPYTVLAQMEPSLG